MAAMKTPLPSAQLATLGPSAPLSLSLSHLSAHYLSLIYLHMVSLIFQGLPVSGLSDNFFVSVPVLMSKILGQPGLVFPWILLWLPSAFCRFIS